VNAIGPASSCATRALARCAAAVEMAAGVGSVRSVTLERSAIAALVDRPQRDGGIEADAGLGGDGDGRAARLEHETRVDGRLRHVRELHRQREAVREAQHGCDRMRIAEREEQPAAHAARVERRPGRACRVDAHTEIVGREAWPSDRKR